MPKSLNSRSYRARLAGWLADDPIPQSLYTDLPESEQCLPFSPEKVAEIGGTQSARAALEAFDPAFAEALRNLVIEPAFDFEYVVNEQQTAIEEMSEWDYTLEHLDEMWELLEPLADCLAAEYGGVRLISIEEDWADSVRLLKCKFADSTTSVWVYLARFGSLFNAQIQKCGDFLKGKEIARNSLWMVRAHEMDSELPRPDQMFLRVIDTQTEARLWAAKHLLDKRAEYEKNGTWADAWKIILAEIQKSYLGELLAHARDRVNTKKAGAPANESVIA